MNKTYRDDALAARRAARARLKEFRAERLAKRGVKSAPAVVPAPHDPSQSPYTVDPDLLYGATATTDAPQTVSETRTEAPDGGLLSGEKDSAPREPIDDLATLDDESIASRPPDDTDPPTPISGRSTGAAPEQATDLASLPCAGDGMVLLFNQCGIHSLADLAMADAADLSLRLGVVGQILDLSPWIDYAREHSGA